MITKEILMKALKETLGRKGMSDEQVEDLAQYVMNFFGFHDEIIDNRLCSEDRDVFYMLEEEGILTTKEEEALLKKAKVWRIHYWVLHKDNIMKFAAKCEQPEEQKEEVSVYEKLPEEEWKRRTSGPEEK